MKRSYLVIQDVEGDPHIHKMVLSAQEFDIVSNRVDIAACIRLSLLESMGVSSIEDLGEEQDD